ncbi:D-alanyl-D-alanine carboxypeptidase/D-alanyl-D-alanine-endopeptidase [Amnibacterium flavum]|uniref:D-alanyl-D-alanine carboxypeptidase/D-alanyl-D-alanine-endopeptidase n=1 Tax=Amnibacterium flavum TaxID=2173173 RepID=A0A2V1HVJ2_9MICO|nr:D-alanyl-D-alanine carboxypeptidase/D-alanyl-D-alanine-endopeptidase [Amnibacterium flavum]
MLIASAAVAYALVLGGAGWAGAATASTAELKRAPAASVVTSTPTPTPTVEVRAVPAAAPGPSRLRTCSVAGPASDGRLQQFQAQVVNASTGEVLYDRGGGTASRTASVLKVLTSAAALSVLGPDYRMSTRVVRGTEPGQVVLVGGGDVTLSRTPSGDESTYSGAPHLDELARQVRAAWDADPATAGTPITSVVTDASYFSGDAWEPSWNRKELYDGYMPQITALMVDGDRENPYRSTSPRGEDPVGRAGWAFADALGGGPSVVSGTAPAGAAVLGQVYSQPVSTLVQQTLIVSDNTIAEGLARVTAIEAGAGSSFSSLQQGITSGLSAYGLDTSQLRIADGSGLSGNNAVPPSYLTSLFVKVMNKEANLWPLYDGLPISGQTGSLSYSDRFSGDSSRADGAVHAKTGWIDDGYTLSGIIYAADGTPLTFAIYALGDVSDSAKQAIDALTAAFWDCGNNLSNL